MNYLEQVFQQNRRNLKMSEEIYLEEDPMPKEPLNRKALEEYTSEQLTYMNSLIGNILADRDGEFYNDDYEKFYDMVEAMFLKYPKHNAFSLGEKSELNWDQFFELLPLPEGRA